ncbi:putative transcriptional regulator [Erwinia toletana]|uniref:Transcriptional regulator n=1 Tax=Winslowiella toletana TaxID=92490 RepID=A0ABS4P807_9GAMM|nr:type II toxin-antitoxin system CcdA family antitoxin [Winslowiella toletana]MBP2168735.1 putative transcriptional regulator [Winslowiella toletana]
MTLATLNLRIDAELKAAFLEAAKAMDRNGSQLIRDLMRETIQRQHDAWFREQVQAGIAQANRGEVLSGESVEASAVAWREQATKKLAGK